MRNLALSRFRTVIPYCKELREICHSVTACILMQQLDYWFERHPHGFFKFLEPCEHEQYRKGDSWQEELGFTVDEFRGAFDKIGIRYLTHTAYEKAKQAGTEYAMPIQLEDGCTKQAYYLSYVDKRSRLTHYRRNHHLLDDTLDRWMTARPGADSQQQQPTAESETEPRTQPPAAQSFKFCVELWDKHLINSVGYGVDKAWRGDRGKEASAMKAILAKLADTTKQQRETGNRNIPENETDAIVAAWGYILKNWDRLEEFHKKFQLSFLNKYLAEIITNLKHEKRNGKASPGAQVNTAEGVRAEYEKRYGSQAGS